MRHTLKRCVHSTLAQVVTVLLLTAVLVPWALHAEPAVWQVDPAHSTVEFSIRHFFTQVPGRFNDFSGTIHFDPEQPSSSSVEFTVQADSIYTNNDRRDQHLRSADFFHVEKFPTLSFESTRVEGSGSDLKVTGDLTLHGVTREVTIPATFLGSMNVGQMGTRAGFHTEFTLDRKDYGIVWNRPLDQGGAILGDEVEIEINVEAVKKEMEQEEQTAE